MDVITGSISKSNGKGGMMKTFKYPEESDAMNEYIKSLPATVCTFDNVKGTVTVEEVKPEEGAADAI